MIYIKENFPDDSSVHLDIQGMLDSGSIPVLSLLFEKHMRRGRMVVLNCKDVRHINRDVMDFLHQIQHENLIIHFPQFMETKKPDLP